jgi:hypothetical protein
MIGGKSTSFDCGQAFKVDFKDFDDFVFANPSGE